MRHQGHAEDLPGQGFDLVQRLRQFYAAALAPAAGMNLGFDHNRKTRQFFGGLPGFGRGEGNAAFGDFYIKFTEKLFGLVFVDLHGPSP